MRKIAFVFPGQGSQHVGMGKDVYEHYEEARNIFKTVDERLGFSLSELCFAGPEGELKLTVNTQPAILTVSCALLSIVLKKGINADYTAGHSLGEYTALVAAGALHYSDAAWIVRQRGALMQDAVPAGRGTMAAIMGIGAEKVLELCFAVGDEGLVQPANYNSPLQVVIAGETAAVAKAVSLAKEFGAKRAVILPVSAPFHSRMLEPVSLKLKDILAKIDISDAALPVITNYNALPVTNAQEIIENLVQQVSNSVRWQQSVEKLIELGVNTFVEIGPGKVLSGLIKSIDKNVEIYNIEDMDTLEKTIGILKRGC